MSAIPKQEYIEYYRKCEEKRYRDFWTAYLTTFLLKVTSGSVRNGLKISPSF